MKTIIAGGREYLFQAQDIEKLNELRDAITEVVSGCARGADTEGEKWADKNTIPVKKFPANWDKWVNQRDIEEMKRWLNMPMLLFYFLGVKGPGICMI